MRIFSKPFPSLRLFLPVALFLLCSLVFAQPFMQQTPEKPDAAGKLVEIKVQSAALRGNLLGDSPEQDVAIYLPPGYEAAQTKRYPCLYLLHGYNGKITHWTHNGYQGLNIQPVMDSLIKSGAIGEMIVVVPNGTNAYLGSFYANSTVTGNWEDYISRDLVSYIDKNYRTLARAESRGIAGHSMGGFGAIVLGMKHADVFGAVYALSPCCLGMEGDLGSANPVWHNVINLKSKERLKKEPETIEDFWTDVFVALSAAFSPNPDRPPLYVDYPFQERDGQLVPNGSTYAKWQSKLPLNMVEAHKQNLLKLRGIYIDFGQNEEFSHIRIGSQLLSKMLAERGIPHIFEIYEGGDHGNKIRERLETKVLPFFSHRLKFVDN